MTDRHCAQSPGYLPARRRRLRLAAVAVAAWLPLAAPVPAQQAAYTYDAAGRLVQVSYANGAGIQYVYDDAGNLLQTVTTGAPCTLTCAGAVPAIAGAGSSVTFAGSATPSACIGSVAFSWSFGDGSPDAGGHSPTHAFAAAGSYGWRMSATIADQTCTASGTVTIVPSGGRARRHLRGDSASAGGTLLPEHGAAQLMLADAATAAPGADLVLANEGGTPASVRIDLLADDGADLGGGTCLLAAHERLVVPAIGPTLGAHGGRGGRLSVRLLTAGARIRAHVAAPADAPGEARPALAP